MILLIPDEIPRPAIAESIAHLGLVLDDSNPTNRLQIARWATDALFIEHQHKCDAETHCTAPAVVKIGTLSYCASHGRKIINHD